MHQHWANEYILAQFPADQNINFLRYEYNFKWVKPSSFRLSTLPPFCSASIFENVSLSYEIIYRAKYFYWNIHFLVIERSHYFEGSSLFLRSNACRAVNEHEIPVKTLFVSQLKCKWKHFRFLQNIDARSDPSHSHSLQLTTYGLTLRIDTDKWSSKQISPDGERYGKTVER